MFTTAYPATTVAVDYLVIAGGGGGGGTNHGAGGGAGGYRTSYGVPAAPTMTLYDGSSYAVTIGAGGAGGHPAPADT